MLVFQYGSNMSTLRLNHKNRLNGDAVVQGIVSTIETFDLGFTVWSSSNDCAAADIIPNKNGVKIHGVLYEIPDSLISRQSARPLSRKSLDAIEGEGNNYKRIEIKLINLEKNIISASTYVVLNRKEGLITSERYAQHIITGLNEHNFTAEYKDYVIDQIISNNPQLEGLRNA